MLTTIFRLPSTRRVTVGANKNSRKPSIIFFAFAPYLNHHSLGNRGTKSTSTYFTLTIS